MDARSVETILDFLRQNVDGNTTREEACWIGDGTYPSEEAGCQTEKDLREMRTNNPEEFDFWCKFVAEEMESEDCTDEDIPKVKGMLDSILSKEIIDSILGEEIIDSILSEEKEKKKEKEKKPSLSVFGKTNFEELFGKLDRLGLSGPDASGAPDAGN